MLDRQTDRQTDRQSRSFILLVFIINLLALSSLIVFAFQHYSEDAYGLVLNGQWSNVDWYIRCFRYFGALITSIVSFFGHNPIIDPTIDTVFFIISAAVSVTVLSCYIYRLLSKNANTSVLLLSLVDLSVLITVVNVWYTDILTFAECIFFDAVGFLLCAVAVVSFSHSKSVPHYIISSIIFICAAASFQQYISIFAIYTILILGIKTVQQRDKCVKSLFIMYLKSALFIVINSSVYYCIGIGLQKLFNLKPNDRASLSVETFINNIKFL